MLSARTDIRIEIYVSGGELHTNSVGRELKSMYTRITAEILIWLHSLLFLLIATPASYTEDNDLYERSIWLIIRQHFHKAINKPFPWPWCRDRIAALIHCCFYQRT